FVNTCLGEDNNITSKSYSFFVNGIGLFLYEIVLDCKSTSKSLIRSCFLFFFSYESRYRSFMLNIASIFIVNSSKENGLEIKSSHPSDKAFIRFISSDAALINTIGQSTC